MDYHILGCGGLGSLLAIQIAKCCKKFDRLFLYDFDIITKQEFIFKKYDIGEYKIEVLKKIIQKENPNLVVNLNFVNIKKLQKTYKESLIIDCRDDKKNLKNIDYDILVSIDKYLLTIDTRKNLDKSNVFKYYTSKKYYHVFNLAASIVLFFIKEYESIEYDNLYVFNLKKIITENLVFLS